MAVRRAERRAGRAERARNEFGEEAEAALDLLELTEFAWHDCFQDITPPDQVVEDMFIVAQGSLSELIHAARLAVQDWRDLRVAADGLRR